MIVAVQSRKSSKSGQRQWQLVDEGAGIVEDKKQRKRRLHREEMVQFRLRKKLQEAELRTQHAQLEQELKHSLAQYKLQSAQGLNAFEEHGEVFTLQIQLRELVVQTETLRAENSTLRDVVAGHNKLQQEIHSEASRLIRDEEDYALKDGGWRVCFAEGQPSFHFHPFTKDECAVIIQQYDRAMTMTRSDGFITVGNLLGWKVERVPLTRHNTGKWMVTRTRFSKLIHCATGASSSTMEKLEAESWPVLTTPELCPRVHRDNCVSLKLQEVDEDTVVLVSNTPQFSRGIHLRHLTMMHRRYSTDEEERRTITYVMVIPDSEANKRSRESEQSRGEVLWVCEGAAYMTLSQIDDSTLRVTYDNCTGCKNELHAQRLLVEWGHEAIRWEQLVTPSRLLSMLKIK
ncbi:hypothetical protein F442_09071 [Phytophthora nicotianae P10297]|uniref:Uncharacterized protein n=1 Tax=Phytophthora nicotianae P10297 TaxID=1317064 RepID=W2ZB76_PHYNI|nr:hypothetical protein F442_09071 [Phytophthora nicotianae P10297]